MAVIKVSVTLPTPCGPIPITYSIPVPFPSLVFPPTLPFPPFKIKIPLPDCSSLKRLATSAPEPAADSKP